MTEYLRYFALTAAWITAVGGPSLVIFGVGWPEVLALRYRIAAGAVGTLLFLVSVPFLFTVLSP